MAYREDNQGFAKDFLKLPDTSIVKFFNRLVSVCQTDKGDSYPYPFHDNTPFLL